mmetsp:Transcript_36385/g.116613  ORF Transcript_36385/g.116613 Transcript_36385/m.116613 type:complete len:172 (-) Transcript_36385:930-1445(-)
MAAAHQSFGSTSCAGKISLSEVGKRFLELRAALRRDLFGVDADGRRGYIFVGVLQMVSVVEIDTWDSTIEVTAETASPVPAFVPVYVAALLCWLPFPDFGMNRAILRERFPMRADARSVEVLDRGSFDHILDCLSPRTIFFLAFHVIPVLAVLALALASGITVQPSQPVAL